MKSNLNYFVFHLIIVSALLLFLMVSGHGKASVGSIMIALGHNGGYNNASNQFQREAIERGYALYCPDTGEWAWKGECEEKSE